MARNQTEYCQLSQWDASDQVLRTEFNGDNAKIDAALAAMSEEVSGKAEVSALAAKADVTALEEVEALALGRAEIRLGTYVGNGAASQLIQLGFKPKAVLVLTTDGGMSDVADGRHYGGLALENQPVASYDHMILSIHDQGFTVYYSSNYRIYTNSNNDTYVYLAVI